MYLICALLLLFLIYLYRRRTEKYKDFNSLPGPPALPILGNLFDVGDNSVEVLRNLRRLNKEYGDIFRLWVGPFNPVVVTCDPKHIETILTSTVHVQKSTTYDIFHSFLGNGLITSPGDETWKKHRKLLTPAFHFKILEKFIDTFHSSGNILIQKLSENLDKDRFNVYPYINRYAIDVLCETSMGLNLDLQNDMNNQYLHNLADYGRRFTMRQFSLIGRNEKLYKYLPEYKDWTVCVDKLKDFTTSVINQKHQQWKQRKTDGNNKNNRREPFLDLLFSVWEKGELTAEEVREELDTFMFAGQETTSSAISFTLFELAKHPEVQEKILEEIKEYIGEDKDDPYTVSNLSNSKYLESVCKECMRLYTTVPYIERGIHHPLEIDGKIIPKGTSLTIFLYGLHMNNKYYKDPEKFDPCRFLPENTVDRNPFYFLPFSAGLRNCIGQRFAMLQVKATVAKVIRNFVLSPVNPPHEILLATNTILRSHNEIPIRIRRRQ